MASTQNAASTLLEFAKEPKISFFVHFGPHFMEEVKNDSPQTIAFHSIELTMTVEQLEQRVFNHKLAPKMRLNGKRLNPILLIQNKRKVFRLPEGYTLGQCGVKDKAVVLCPPLLCDRGICPHSLNYISQSMIRECYSISSYLISQNNDEPYSPEHKEYRVLVFSVKKQTQTRRVPGQLAFPERQRAAQLRNRKPNGRFD